MGQLIGGQVLQRDDEMERQDRPMIWNVEGTAQPKKPADYKVVGTSPKRRDVAAKVFAKPTYVTDISRSRHGSRGGSFARRWRVRSRFRSIKVRWRGIPRRSNRAEAGLPRRRADKEWDAVAAPRRSSRVKLVASRPRPLPRAGEKKLYDYIREAPVRKRTVEKQTRLFSIRAITGAAKIGPPPTMMAVPVGMPAWARAGAVAQIKDGKATLLGPATPKAALRARWRFAALAQNARRARCRRFWRIGPGFLWPVTIPGDTGRIEAAFARSGRSGTCAARKNGGSEGIAGHRYGHRKAGGPMRQNRLHLLGRAC